MNEWLRRVTMDFKEGKEMRRSTTRSVVFTVMLMGLSASMAFGGSSVQAADKLDRTVLPIPEPKRPPITEIDVRKATAPPRFEIKAPAGAPNVLIVLIDDMGFGHVQRVRRSHSHADGRATRRQWIALQPFPYDRALLADPCRITERPQSSHEQHGRDHGILDCVSRQYREPTEQCRAAGRDVAAERLQHRLSSARTTRPRLGKSAHPVRPTAGRLAPASTSSTAFIGGETNQWAPLLYDGLTQVELRKDPNYHFMTDMTNQAIHWMRYQKSLTPDKPFFMYFAPGATHAPHHVPKEWIAKYKGKFDGGWDQFREETLARQIKLGVVPQGTKLAPKPDAIKDWDKLSDDEKKLFSRQMEIFAGFGEYTDTEIGRLVQAVEQTGQMDNTLIFYIIGDNGTSAEGGMNGLFNEMTYFNGVHETVQDILKHYDDLGGPLSYPHMAAGWAVAGDTPFTWTKQVASSFGGTRNGMVVHWPKRIKAKGEVRAQFHHVIDIAPTVLEAAELPEPKVVNGTPQEPIEGVSMVYTFANAKATSRHYVQYFEILGNRAIYSDGWLAGTLHRAPWEPKPRTALVDDKWELYDTRNDFSLVNNLAAKNPTKLKELQDLFLKEAVKNHVLPIDDRVFERMIPAMAGRPDLMGESHISDGLRGDDRDVGERLH